MRLDLQLDDVSELKVAEEGIYSLIIDKVEVKETEKGMGLNCIILFDGRPELAAIWHFVSLPGEADDSKKLEFKKLMVARFCHAFDIPTEDGLDTDTFVGAHGDCQVTVENYNNEDRNKLVLPRLPQKD